MKSMVRLDLTVPLRLALHMLARACARTADAVVAHMIAHRKVRVSEELYRHLSRLSDAELAARGLDRKRLAQSILERLG